MTAPAKLDLDAIEACANAASKRHDVLTMRRALDVLELTANVRRLRAANARLVEAVYANRRGLSHDGDDDCWCEHGVGNPMAPTHSNACKRLRAAVATAKVTP